MAYFRVRFTGADFRFAFLALGLTLGGCGGGSGQAVTPAGAAPVQAATVSAPSARARGAVAPSGFSALRVSFGRSLLSDNGFLIASYAQKYGIQTIFVPVSGDDISSLLAGNPTTVKNLNAMSAVAKVYMVAGDASWLTTPTVVPRDAAPLANLAALYPQFAGVLYAADPETSPGWKTTQRTTLIASYFTLVQTLLAAPGSSAFREKLFMAHADFAVLSSGSAGSPTP